MKNRKNLFFGIWLILVFVFVVVMIVVYSKSVESPNATTSPTASPAETESPTSAPQESQENTEYIAEIPRSSQVSLNPGLDYTQVLGGSGSDVAAGVITLDTYYLYGTTTSSDIDFSAGEDADIFLAKIGMSGEVVGAITINSSGNDIVLDAKAYSKQSESSKAGIAIIYQTEGKTDAINITKISQDLENDYTQTIKFDGDVTLVEALSTTTGIILYVNINDSINIYSEIVYLAYDLSEESRLSVTLSSEIKIVSAYTMNGTEILLINIYESDQSYIAILEVDAETGDKVLTKFQGNYQTAIAMTPKSSGGFMVEYTYLENGVNKYGVLSVTSEYNIEFTHVLSGGDYTSVIVLEDYRLENSMGYFVFATKETSSAYDTFSEYICTHGDLIYVDTSFLSGILPLAFHVSDSGIVAIGEVKNDGQTDIAMVSATSEGVVERYETYGGSGEEAYVFSIINRYGNLDVFANTLSSGDDIPFSLGKSDVFMFEISSD